MPLGRSCGSIAQRVICLADKQRDRGSVVPGAWLVANGITIQCILFAGDWGPHSIFHVGLPTHSESLAQDDEALLSQQCVVALA